MNETAVVPTNNFGIEALGDIAKIEKKLEEVKLFREAVSKFIDSLFVEKVDFGPAVGASGAKPTLLLPGAEKLCAHFNLQPDWKADKEIWEMLGSPKNTVCLVCELVNNNSGRVVGTGRGACVVGEASKGLIARDTNGTIKIAKKRALIDAVKNFFMLSERFTQDMEGFNNFIEMKRQIFIDVQEKRRGIDSSLSDKDFLSMVCQREIHKKNATTKKEIEIVYEAIDKYDFATGEKLPDNLT